MGFRIGWKFFQSDQYYSFDAQQERREVAAEKRRRAEQKKKHQEKKRKEREARAAEQRARDMADVEERLKVLEEKYRSYKWGEGPGTSDSRRLLRKGVPGAAGRFGYARGVEAPQGAPLPEGAVIPGVDSAPRDSSSQQTQAQAGNPSPESLNLRRSGVPSVSTHEERGTSKYRPGSHDTQQGAPSVGSVPAYGKLKRW